MAHIYAFRYMALVLLGFALGALIPFLITHTWDFSFPFGFLGGSIAGLATGVVLRLRQK